LLMAVALSCICLMIAGITPNSLASLFKLPGTTWVRFAYIASYSLAAWFWTFSFIGLAMRFMSNKNASRRYLADASYWLYLIHVPIILLLQIETAQWALSWMVKFPLILSITLTIGLGTYHSMVRYTVIGAILNGKRYRVKDKMAVTIQPIEALDQKA